MTAPPFSISADNLHRMLPSDLDKLKESIGSSEGVASIIGAFADYLRELENPTAVELDDVARITLQLKSAGLWEKIAPAHFLTLVGPSVEPQVAIKLAAVMKLNPVQGSAGRRPALVTASARQLPLAPREDNAEIGKTMEVQLASIQNATHELNRQLSLITSDVDRKIREMTDASIRAVARASGISQGFEQQAEKLNKLIETANAKASELTEKFRAQSAELNNASATAVERIGQLQKTQTGISRDTFLKAATHMINELNGIALDIHELLDKDIPDEIWKKYREGDRSIFARRLFKSKDSYVVPALEQRYQRDERFRDLVDRYVAKFETLLSQSQQADSESVLSAAFITADVGKLYLVLAKSLGRAVEH